MSFASRRARVRARRAATDRRSLCRCAEARPAVGNLATRASLFQARTNALSDRSSARFGGRRRSSPPWDQHRRPARTTASIRAPARRLQARDARLWRRAGGLPKAGPTPAFVLARVSPLAAWLPLSDTGSATAGGMAAALMLATSRLLASAGRPEVGRGALAGVERAFRANRVSWRAAVELRRNTNAGLGSRGGRPCVCANRQGRSVQRDRCGS
jgi:hypothetical protein